MQAVGVPTILPLIQYQYLYYTYLLLTLNWDRLISIDQAFSLPLHIE